MNEGLPWLTLLTLIPLVGGVVVVGLSSGRPGRARGLAAGVSGLALVVAAMIAARFDPASGALQFVERHPWIPSLGVDYFLGVDGLGLVMVLLTALLVPLSLGAGRLVTERAPLYYGLVLFLESGLFGAFTALNFFHWFLFWELSLIPAFFLIKLWGGPARSAAATQFFVYTMVGSVTLLLSFMALLGATGTLDFVTLAAMAREGTLVTAVGSKLTAFGLEPGTTLGLLCFGAFLGFAVKVPLMPFHTWLPAAYAEAPSAVTMLLTGALSKMGVYGFARILLPIFPDPLRAWQTPLLGLSVLTVVAGAAAAFAQRDLKRLLAYSSINHLGYCLLGLFALMGGPVGDAARVGADRVAALNGVMLQMFNHGLTAAVLFAFVGWIEERSEGRRGLDDFGGLRRVAPVFAGVMGVALFSSLGLPGLNGFVGEFLIFKGVFGLAAWGAAVSTLGLLITAVVLLTVVQRVFGGPLDPGGRPFPDLTLRERWVLAPAVVLMGVLGLWPQAAVGLFNQTSLAILGRL